LIDRGKHSSGLDVLSFWAIDCGTDQYPVVAEVRVRLAVNKKDCVHFIQQGSTLRFKGHRG
jgi:hypothetical protein